MLIDLEIDTAKVKKKIDFINKRKLDKDMQEKMFQNYADKRLKELNKVLTNPKQNLFADCRVNKGLYNYFIDYYSIEELAKCKKAIRYPEIYKIGENNWKLSYGYADSLEQVLELYSDKLNNKDRNYIISYMIINNPTLDHIYKHGEYIGNKECPLKQESICKYLIYEIVL